MTHGMTLDSKQDLAVGKSLGSILSFRFMALTPWVCGRLDLDRSALPTRLAKQRKIG
jgi:hypothetical protein